MARVLGNDSGRNGVSGDIVFLTILVAILHRTFGDNRCEAEAIHTYYIINHREVKISKKRVEVRKIRFRKQDWQATQNSIREILLPARLRPAWAFGLACHVQELLLSRGVSRA